VPGVKPGVVPACLVVMMFGMAGVAMGAVGVVRRLLVIAGFMMPGGFAVMFRGLLVMFGSLLMVFYALVIAHVFSPDLVIISNPRLRNASDSLLTASRQVCCNHFSNSSCCHRPARPGDPVFQRRQRLSREAAAYWMPRIRGV
jgi:hypothetical protein